MVLLLWYRKRRGEGARWLLLLPLLLLWLLPLLQLWLLLLLLHGGARGRFPPGRAW